MSLLSKLQAAISLKHRRPAKPRRVRSESASHSARHELIRAAVRDTLMRHGIPTAWIDSEAIPSTETRGSREGSVHVRLLVRHFEPQLLAHGLAFQNSFLRRLASFDPTALRWLGGVSWDFAASPDRGGQMPSDPGPQGMATRPTELAMPRKAAGPTEQEKLAELHRLFTVSDAARALAGNGADHHSDFENTRPFEANESASR